MKYLVIVCAIVSLIVLILVIVILIQNKNPKIELGVLNGRLREIPDKKNAVCTETKFKDKLVQPLKFKNTLKESKEAVKAAFDSYGDIDIKIETQTYIYAVSTTKIFKFNDDIELFFDEENKKIQYRSSSRVGYSDMGLNRERYNIIASLYEKF